MSPCRHNERLTVQIIWVRCCLLVTFDRCFFYTVLYCTLQIGTMHQIKENGVLRKPAVQSLAATLRVRSVTAHTCLIVGIYSARVFTQTRAPFALAFSTQHGSCFPNKSDCWQTCKLMIWTPETIWIGKNTKLVCGAFGPCHVFIVTVTGKFLLPSPSVLLKEQPNIIQQF